MKTVEGKYLKLLSSPSRAKGQRLFQTTRVLLKRATLLEYELRGSRKGAIEIQKENLNRRKVLSKGGSTYAIVGIQRIRAKRIQEAHNDIRRARRELSAAINRQAKKFEKEGIQQRKQEIERKKKIKDLQRRGQVIPAILLIPIIDY